MRGKYTNKNKCRLCWHNKAFHYPDESKYTLRALCHMCWKMRDDREDRRPWHVYCATRRDAVFYALTME